MHQAVGVNVVEDIRVKKVGLGIPERPVLKVDKCRFTKEFPS